MQWAWLTILLLSQLVLVHSQDDDECEEPREFLECGSACLPTCRKPEPEICTQQCVPICRCPTQTPIWHNDECITAEECTKESLVDQCLVQIDALEETDAVLAGILRGLIEDIEDEDIEADDLSDIVATIKDNKEVAKYLGKCIELISYTVTARNCTKETAFAGVCGNSNPESALENCHGADVDICEVLLHALENETCLSEDEDKFERKGMLTHTFVHFAECKKNLSDLPVDALFNIDEHDWEELLTDEDVAEIVIDVGADLIPFLPCHLKEEIARLSFNVTDAQDKLSSLEDTTAGKVLLKVLPYLSKETCNLVIADAMDFLVAHIDDLKDLYFECRDEDNPSLEFLEEMEKEEESARKKRQTEDEFKIFLAEENSEEKCSSEFSCGKLVAKALLGRKEQDIKDAANPCDEAMESLGGMFFCLSDKSKEDFISCDTSQECAAQFNSEEKVKDVLDKKGCSKEDSSVCSFYCEKDFSSENVCQLMSGDKAECLWNRECFEKLKEDLCDCAGAGERCNEIQIELSDFKPSDFENSDFAEILEAKEMDERTEKEEKLLQRYKIKENEDKTAEEVSQNPGTFAEDMGYIKKSVREEAIAIIVENTSPTDILDSVVDGIANLDTRAIKSLMNAVFEKMKEVGDDIGDIPDAIAHLIPRKYVEDYPIEVICTADGVSSKLASLLSEKYMEYLASIAGVTLTEENGEEVVPEEIFEAIADNVVSECLLFLTEDDVSKLPDDIAGTVIELISNDELNHIYKREGFCKQHLKKIGKSLDEDSTMLHEEDLSLEGIGCVKDIRDFSSLLGKVTAKFLLQLLLNISPSPICLPQNILDHIEEVITKLSELSIQDFADEFLGDYIGILDVSEGDGVHLEEHLENLRFDFKDYIEQARSDCTKTKTDKQKEVEKLVSSGTKDKFEFSSSRRKRSALPWRFQRSTSYTCAELEALGLGVASLTVDEIEGITDSEFQDCVDEFGKHEYETDEHYTLLLQRALVALDKTVCNIDYDDATTLDKLLLALTTDNIDCLTVDVDIIGVLGLMDAWDSEQASHIVSNYMSTKSVTTAALTVDDLVLINNLVCAIPDLADLDPVELALVVLQWDGLSSNLLDTDCVTEIVQVLKHDTAYGQVSTWESDALSDICIFAGGLSGDELNMMGQEDVDEICNEAIPLIHKDEFAEVSTTFLGYLSGDQARSVTDEQKDALSDEKQNVLNLQQYGTYTTIVIGDGDDDDDDGDDDTSDGDSGASPLTVSMAMLLMSALASFWF